MGIKESTNEGIFQSQKTFSGELAKTFVNNDDNASHRLGAVKKALNMICGQALTARSRLGTQGLALSRYPMFTMQIGLYTIIFLGKTLHDRNSTDDDEIYYSIYYDQSTTSAPNDPYAYFENLDRIYCDSIEDMYTKSHEDIFFTPWTKFTLKRSDKITGAKPRLDFNKLQHYSVLVDSRTFWRVGFYFGILDFNFNPSSTDAKDNIWYPLEFIAKRSTAGNEFLLDQISDFSTCIVWDNALVILDKGFVFISVDTGVQFFEGTATSFRDFRYDFNTIYATYTMNDITVVEAGGTGAGPSGRLTQVLEGAFRLQFTGKGTLDNVMTNVYRFKNLLLISSTNHLYRVERTEKNNAYNTLTYKVSLIYNEGCKRGNLLVDVNRIYMCNVNGLYLITLKEGLAASVYSDVYIVSIYAQHRLLTDVIKLSLRRYRGDANLYMHHLDGTFSVVSIPSIVEKDGTVGIPRVTTRTPKNANEIYTNDEHDFYYYMSDPMYTNVVARFLKNTEYYQFPHPYYSVERELFPDSLHDNKEVATRFDFNNLRNYTYLDGGCVLNGVYHIKVIIKNSKLTFYYPKYAKLKQNDSIIRHYPNVDFKQGDTLIFIKNTYDCTNCATELICQAFVSAVNEEDISTHSQGSVKKSTITLEGLEPLEDGLYTFLGVNVIEHFKSLLAVGFNPRSSITRQILNRPTMKQIGVTPSSNDTLTEEVFYSPTISHVAYMTNGTSQVCVMSIEEFIGIMDKITTCHIAFGYPFARELRVFSHSDIKNFSSSSHLDIVLDDTEEVYISEKDIDHTLIPNNCEAIYSKSPLFVEKFADIYKVAVPIITTGKLHSAVKDISYTFRFTVPLGKNLHVLGYNLQIAVSKK